MMRDIKSGALQVDLILVDTLERFGRVDELPTIRKRLFERHGVLVLTGDSAFADPNTPQGRALGMVESMRATEHGRILGLNVLRGKRDSAKLKHWPGGPPSFGFKLKSIMKDEKGRKVIDHSILVPKSKTRRIVKLLFNKAAESGWGTTRLARFLNDRKDIPEKFKPFHPASIGYMLDNPIYFGTLRWELNATGIIDDMRVVEPNSVDDVLLVPEFCQPLVDRDVWDRAQALREARRRRVVADDGDEGKRIEPPAPGLSLNYLLSGLVFCAECGYRMTASSTAEYIDKKGTAKRYTSYVCSRYRSGSCSNGTSVPEQWLREVIVQKIRERLFPFSK